MVITYHGHVYRIDTEYELSLFMHWIEAELDLAS